ncbi:hypothetical protein [Streptomyces sp. RPA4-5]|nr:hypothetical protein [Streptomyces sp. RPA4-5]
MAPHCLLLLPLLRWASSMIAIDQGGILCRRWARVMARREE